LWGSRDLVFTHCPEVLRLVQLLLPHEPELRAPQDSLASEKDQLMKLAQRSAF
jgi:hypothetical protein